ncbi:unnamed protein product [Polarella glacialis]|uniref:SAM domain-containing protein n=1 Tax=Polarella glacialis TaxID=89957 RepID=A0A813HB27_POLGL|nr:unnamed protein product [Polarella glacialis]
MAFVKDDDDKPDEKPDEKPEMSPWAQPDLEEDKPKRVVGWRMGQAFTEEEVREIMRKEKGARQEYRGLKKVVTKSRQKEQKDPMVGLPPTWQEEEVTEVEVDLDIGVEGFAETFRDLVEEPSPERAEAEFPRLEFEAQAEIWSRDQILADQEGVVAAGPVTSFLEECRMGQYAQRFEAAGYDDLHTLIYTEERHLKELGMPPGHILKLQRKLEERRDLARGGSSLAWLTHYLKGGESRGNVMRLAQFMSTQLFVKTLISVPVCYPVLLATFWTGGFAALGGGASAVEVLAPLMASTLKCFDTPAVCGKPPAVSTAIEAVSARHCISLLDAMNERAEEGDLPGAERIFDEIIRDGGLPPRMQTMLHNTLLKACANSGDLRKAVALYSRMRSEGLKLNQRTFGKIIKAAAMSNSSDQALQWLAAMRRECGSVDQASLGAAIDAFARAHQCDEAVRLLQGPDFAEAGLAPDRAAYSAVVKAFAHSGRPREAAQWLAKMESAMISPDRLSFNTVIHACAKVGQVEQAVDWMTRMESAGLSSDVFTYSSLVDACAKAGRPQDAMAWLAKMDTAGLEPNVISFNSVLDACGRAGLVLEAEDYLRQMVERGLSPGRASYTSLVQAVSKAGRPPEEAAAWLARAVSAGVSPDFQLYNSVINAFAKAQQLDRSIALLDTMEERHIPPTVVSYTSIIVACSASNGKLSLTREGRTNLVEALLRRMLAAKLKPDRFLLTNLGRVLGPARLEELRIELSAGARPGR